VFLFHVAEREREVRSIQTQVDEESGVVGIRGWVLKRDRKEREEEVERESAAEKGQQRGREFMRLKQ
jgi:hypothetical protein